MVDQGDFQEQDWNNDDPRWGFVTPDSKNGPPDIEPPKWALVVMILVVLAIITPFLIILWRWALS